MLETLHVRRWEKRDRTTFYWVMLLVCISMKTWYSSKSFWYFEIKNYEWGLDIVQNLCELLKHCAWK